ncbi:hypothetical protein SLE2022_058490 [Rubroshorea leprosula]
MVASQTVKMPQKLRSKWKIIPFTHLIDSSFLPLPKTIQTKSKFEKCLPPKGKASEIAIGSRLPPLVKTTEDEDKTARAIESRALKMEDVRNPDAGDALRRNTQGGEKGEDSRGKP